MRDIASETDAARAKDAAFRVEHDARAEINGLGLVNLGFDKAARALAVVHGVFLQLRIRRPGRRSGSRADD